MTSHYCSKECQTAHWPQHKIPCKVSKTEKQQQEVAAAAAVAKAKKLKDEKAATITAVRNPPCAFCGGVSFETCSGCGYTHYCSRDCQKKHWSVHKIPCRTSPIYIVNQQVAAEKKKLAEEEQTLGVDNQVTLCTVLRIGHLLREQGKLKEAEGSYRRTLEGCERTLGLDHPDTLSSVNSLGLLLHDQGKLDLAEPFYRRALEGFERTLGRDHPSTLHSARCLEILLETIEKAK
jgi:tetratricopeptide (TPR) repeat protein